MIMDGKNTKLLVSIFIHVSAHLSPKEIRRERLGPFVFDLWASLSTKF